MSNTQLQPPLIISPCYKTLVTFIVQGTGALKLYTYQFVFLYGNLFLLFLHKNWVSIVYMRRQQPKTGSLETPQRDRRKNTDVMDKAVYKQALTIIVFK